jgi:HSP20 family molecular chaperone IbpA
MSTETTMSKHDTRSPEKMQQRQAFAPPVDIFENKDELVILADLPGVAREDLHVNVDKDQLTIEGRRAGEDAIDYRRTFVVPRGIDAEKIAANLTSGVLRLVLPKPAALKPRQIEVKAG